jgi:hypothetical protein
MDSERVKTGLVYLKSGVGNTDKDGEYTRYGYSLSGFPCLFEYCDMFTMAASVTVCTNEDQKS